PQGDQNQLNKVMGYIEAGKTDEAIRLAGSNRVGEKGYFIEPTVFADVQDNMKIAQEEIFGPVMSILKFKDLGEVVERANKNMYGLAAAVWTQDITKAHAIADSVRAGTVWVNCYDVFDGAAPFGGFKQSGIGRELGEYGLANYTEVKRAQHLRHGINLSHWFSQVFDPKGYTKEHFDAYDTAQDIALIKAMGFDHVRFTVNCEPMFRRGQADRIPAEYLAMVDGAVKMILGHNLNVIIDIHPESDFK